MSSTMLRSLLAAGTALALAGAAHAQSSGPAAGTVPPSQQTQAPAGGLILPGTVAPTQGVAAPTPAPQAPAAQQRPAAQAPAAQPQARPQQAAPAAAAQGAPRPPAKPAAALAEWEIAPQVFSDGSFKLCAAENKFDNGLFLILMANADKRLNIMIAKQGGGFPPGQRFPVKLRIDGKSKIERERGAMTASPEVIMTGVGDDQEFVKGLGTGSALFVEIPGDTAAFQLKGTAKMTADLMGCVDKAKAGQLQLPPPPPAMPPQLANILVQAGLKDARAIPVDKLAPEQRPGDFAWQLGDKIVGAVRYFRPPAEAGDLTKLSQEFVDSLGKSCQGTYTPALKAVENLPQVELRTGSAGCVQKEGGNVHVAMLMYKAKDGTFAVFTHEATDAEKAKAEEASAGIAKVLRELAKKPPEQPQGQAGQQAPAAAAPKKQ